MNLGVIAVLAVAPALPVISTLGAVLAFCLAVALTVLWVQILRGPLVHLAAVRVARWHPFGWLNAVVHNVDRWLDATVKGTERGVTWSFHALMVAYSTTSSVIADLAQATWQAVEWERRHTTRHVGAKTGQSISPRLGKLEKEWRGIDQRLDQIEHRERAQRAAGAAAATISHASLQHGIDRLRKAIGQILEDLRGIEHANTHAGAKAKPGTKAIPRTKPRAVPRTRAPAHHWTDVFTKAAAATLVIAAFARLGLSWLRCPALSRVGRKIGCGGFGLMESLLALTFDAWLVTDLCRIVNAMTSAARLFAGEIDYLATQISGLIQCQDAQRPKPLPVAWHEPPPVVHSLTL